MSNAHGWTAPGYLSPADWTATQITFPTTGGLSATITRTGAYFAAQSDLDTISAQADTANIALIFTVNPPMGYVYGPGPHSQNVYPTPALIAAMESAAANAAGASAASAAAAAASAAGMVVANDAAVNVAVTGPGATKTTLDTTYATVVGASSTKSASFASALGLPLQAYDNFQRSDRDLSTDVGSNGLGYSVMHEPSPGDATTMNIVSGVCRRQNTTANGSPILQLPVKSQLSAIAAEYSFSGGTTTPTGAIIGTCTSFFGNGSIQIAVHPTGWQIFSYNGSSTIFASGTFATPLAADGVTRYQTFAWFDATSNTLTFSIPTGDGTVNNTVHTLVDSRLATTWGGVLLCIQANVNASTDPDIVFYQMAGA